MGVEQWGSRVSTPSLTLPLQWGGDVSPNGLFGNGEEKITSSGLG